MFNLHGHQANKNTLISSPHLTTNIQSLGMSPLEYQHGYQLPNKIPQNVVAIGECGLDRVTTHPTWQMQLSLFQLHIESATQHQLPLIIHCVKSYSEVHALLKKNRFQQTVIFHAYNGNNEQTKQLLKNKNYYFSIGHLLLQKSSISQTINLIPIERLFFETDMKPPEILTKIYQQAADRFHIDCQKLIKQVETNKINIFGEIFSVE